VLDHAVPAGTLVSGAVAPRVLGLDDAKLEEIDAPTLRKALTTVDVTVVDFGTSIQYRDAHIPGAWFAVRSRLRDALGLIGPRSGSYSRRPTAPWRGSQRSMRLA